MPKYSLQVHNLTITMPVIEGPAQSTEVKAKEIRRNYELVKNAKLRLEKGKIYRLLGKSGSGKSILLKALSGNWPLCAGRVRVNCQPMDESSSGLDPENKLAVETLIKNNLPAELLTMGGYI